MLSIADIGNLLIFNLIYKEREDYIKKLIDRRKACSVLFIMMVINSDKLREKDNLSIGVEL